MQNQRQFFRVRLFNESVIVQTPGRVYQGIIRDLSGNGISFYLPEDVAFDECYLEFTLKEETYHLAARPVRKEKTTYGEYVYACTFANVPQKTQSAMMATLLRLDAVRRKK